MTRWNPRWSASSNARHVLPLMMRDYFAEVREKLAADPPPAELHTIRLATKRVRYTLELFRPCYGPGLEKHLAALQRLQQILGEVNDCAAAERLIEQLTGQSTEGLPPASTARRRMQSYLRLRASEKAAALRKEWREVFDAPGKEQWWLRYLAGKARVAKGRL